MKQFVMPWLNEFTVRKNWKCTRLIKPANCSNIMNIVIIWWAFSNHSRNVSLKGNMVSELFLVTSPVIWYTIPVRVEQICNIFCLRCALLEKNILNCCHGTGFANNSKYSDWHGNCVHTYVFEVKEFSRTHFKNTYFHFNYNKFKIGLQSHF